MPKVAYGPRRKNTYALAGLIVAVVSALIALAAYVWPRSDQSEPVPPQQATLEARQFENTRYYPKDGMLPNSEPPTYSPEQRFNHCEEWESWARNVEAAPTSQSVYIAALANVTSPLTIIDIQFEVYDRRPMMGNQEIQCQVGAGPVFATTVLTDLDNPSRQSPLSFDGDNSVEGMIPGTVVRIAKQEAEYLCVRFDGSEGFVYEYGIVLRVVENGIERNERLGARDQPLRMAFGEVLDSYNERPRYEQYDWNFTTRSWEVTPDI